MKYCRNKRELREGKSLNLQNQFCMAAFAAPSFGADEGKTECVRSCGGVLLPFSVAPRQSSLSLSSLHTHFDSSVHP